MFPEKPTVSLHARVQYGLCIKKGEEIRIDANVSGSPYPKITWTRNEEDVTKEPTKKIVPLVRKKKKSKAQVSLLTCGRIFDGIFVFFCSTH